MLLYISVYGYVQSLSISVSMSLYLIGFVSGKDLTNTV